MVSQRSIFCPIVWIAIAAADQAALKAREALEAALPWYYALCPAMKFELEDSGMRSGGRGSIETGSQSRAVQTKWSISSARHMFFPRKIHRYHLGSVSRRFLHCFCVCSSRNQFAKATFPRDPLISFSFVPSVHPAAPSPLSAAIYAGHPSLTHYLVYHFTRMEAYHYWTAPNLMGCGLGKGSDVCVEEGVGWGAVRHHGHRE
jgi:hypothetical protein